MKKVVSLLLVVVFVLAFSSVAFGMCEVGLESSPAFEEGQYSWENQYNEDVRFDTENFRMAVPGDGGANADDNAALIEWGDGSLVQPFDTVE